MQGRRCRFGPIQRRVRLCYHLDSTQDHTSARKSSHRSVSTASTGDGDGVGVASGVAVFVGEQNKGGCNRRGRKT